jgi:hypothetical protein
VDVRAPRSRRRCAIAGAHAPFRSRASSAASPAAFKGPAGSALACGRSAVPRLRCGRCECHSRVGTAAWAPLALTTAGAVRARLLPLGSARDTATLALALALTHPRSMASVSLTYMVSMWSICTQAPRTPRPQTPYRLDALRRPRRGGWLSTTLGRWMGARSGRTHLLGGNGVHQSHPLDFFNESSMAALSFFSCASMALICSSVGGGGPAGG